MIKLISVLGTRSESKGFHKENFAGHAPVGQFKLQYINFASIKFLQF